jgi:hypothetical protein
MTDAEQKKTDNWAEMSDGEVDEPEVEEPVEEKEEEVKIVIPPPMKGTKNKGGDYVVTSIDIPDLRDGVKSKANGDDEDESDSDEGYGDEEEPAKEEEGKAPVEEGKSCYICVEGIWHLFESYQ